MKNNVPNSVNPNAIAIFRNVEPSPKKISDTIIPNFAQSMIPIVDGDTNLLFEIVCIIIPAMLKLAPVTKTLISLGILLISANSMSFCCPLNNPSKLNPFTPILNEYTDNIIIKSIKIYLLNNLSIIFFLFIYNTSSLYFYSQNI